MGASAAGKHNALQKAVWFFVGFTLLHVALVLLVDPASLRAMITGWYRGRFPSHD